MQPCRSCTIPAPGAPLAACYLIRFDPAGAEFDDHDGTATSWRRHRGSAPHLLSETMQTVLASR